MLTVNRRDLVAALRRATKISPKNSHTLPLRNVHVSIDADSITLRTTNLEQSLVEILPAQGQAARVTVCIPSTQLIGVVLALPQYLQEVPLEAHRDSLVVGTTRLTSACSPAEYPVIPRPPENAQATVELPGDFMQHLRFVQSAVSQDSVRGVLNGILFDFRNGNIAASDGKRLHCAHLWNPARVDSVVIPPCALDVDVASHVSIPQPSKEGIASVFLFTPNGYVVTQTLEGNFPNYLNIVPKDYRVVALVDRTELAGAIEQSLPMLSDRNPSCALSLNGRLEIHAENKDTGATYENEVGAVLEGPALKVHVNPHNLLATLRTMTGHEVTMTFRKPGDAIHVISESGDQWALVMPLVLDTPVPAKR